MFGCEHTVHGHAKQANRCGEERQNQRFSKNHDYISALQQNKHEISSFALDRDRGKEISHW